MAAMLLCPAFAGAALTDMPFTQIRRAHIDPETPTPTPNAHERKIPLSSATSSWGYYGVTPESHDGKRLCYALYPEPTGLTDDVKYPVHPAELWVCNIDGTGHRSLFKGNSIVHNGLMQSWIDNERIVFASDGDIYIINADTGKIEFGPFEGFSPGHYALGGKILMYPKENFTKPRGIYEFDTATGKMRLAVPYNDRIWHTQCSPGGEKILFRTEVNNQDRLAIADAKSGVFKIFPGIKPMHFQWFDKQSFFGYAVPNVIGGDPNTHLHEMYRWNLDGKIIEHLAGYGCHGAARADGKYFAGESWYGSDPTVLRLYVRGSRDSLHTIFSHNFVSPTWHNGRHHVNPSFSRDGMRLYYKKAVNENTSHACRYDLTGLVSPQEYVEFDPPPLFLLKADEAAKLRDIVATAPYDKAYKTLIEDADAVLGDRPNPLKDIIYEGRVSNHPDRLKSVRHLLDMNKIYTLTWAHFVSGKKIYSAKAIEFVEAWAKKCEPSGNDVNDNKLLTCMLAYQMLREEMTKAQKQTIRKWIKSIGDAQQKNWSDKKRGNRAGKRLKLIYFAAYLDNDQDRIEWVRPKIQAIWSSTLFGNGETLDFQRRDAMHYHFSTARAFLQVAHVGRLAGKDHYNQEADNGGSIARSIDFAMPFIKGEKIHPEWVNSKTKLDHERWEAGDPYYRPGKPWDPWEAYKSLMLASPFDESLLPLAEKLRQDKNEPLPWIVVLARASLADDLNSPRADYLLTAAVSGPVSSGLIVTDLGKDYSYNPEVTPANLYFDDTDIGGDTSTSVRNDAYDNLEWKDDEGYYQRNRDLGMIFNPIENMVLDAIVLRTSGSNKAVKTGAPGAPVIMQIFEVVGTPVLNNNGTGEGDTAEGRYGDSHAMDDYVEGVEYVQLLLATGGTFPIHDVTSSSDDKGKFRFMRWDITNDMQLIGGKRYMFLVGFENPIHDCSIALANINPITAQSNRGDNIYLHTDPAGKKWWGVRREGNSTYPPTRAPGSAPFPEPGGPLKSQLKTESIFENDRLTNPEDDPVSDGFPSIDTYRTLQFYIETTDGGITYPSGEAHL